MRFILLLFLGTLVLSSIEARIYNECELARELIRYGEPFGMDKLPHWICLVKWESSFRTDAINTKNTDGSTDYGLFQINSQYWCEVGYPGGGCCANCLDFLKDNISQSVQCAAKIYSVQGFYAWIAWRRHCEGQMLPDLRRCFQRYEL